MSKKTKEPPKPKSLRNRKCTDVLCLLIFFAFLGLLVCITVFAMMAGDGWAIIYGNDYLGNRCGRGAYSNKKKTFYPRIGADFAAQSPADITSSLTSAAPTAGALNALKEIKLYGLCVESCPSIPSGATYTEVVDYGYDATSADTIALGSGTQAVWPVFLDSLEVFNRCFPRPTSTGTGQSMCAYPNCTAPAATAIGAVCSNTAPFTNGEWDHSSLSGGESVCQVLAVHDESVTHRPTDGGQAAATATFTNFMGTMMEILDPVMNSIVYIIVGGIVVPVVLVFVYMLLLYLFAKTIIWGLIFILIAGLLFATFICFAWSGVKIAGVSGASLLSSGQSLVNGSAVAGGAGTALDYTSNIVNAANSDVTWPYTVGFIILLILTFIVVITVVANRRKIRICAAIVKEATTVFTSMPLLMFFPSCTMTIGIVVVAWFLFSSILIWNTEAEAFTTALGMTVNSSSVEFLSSGLASVPGVSVDPIAEIRTTVTADSFRAPAQLLLLFGMLVLTQFISATGWCTMSGATYYWYFFRNASGEEADERTKWPITRALSRTVYYNSGSVAFAAFVIAVCDLVRIIIQYIERQISAKVGAKASCCSYGMLILMVVKCLSCCVYCVQKTVKFISYYGLVFVACQGNSFCLACYRTFFFFLQHPGQVGINALVTWLLQIFASFSIPTFCSGMFFFVLQSQAGARNPLFPTILIFCLGFFVASMCMAVFKCVITTIFVCCFQDKLEFEGKYMSKRLAKAFQMPYNDKKEGAAGSSSSSAAADDCPPETQKL